ncbi:AAA family ATPase [Thermococcus sp.]|uniref:McrB family protein n=1 Tax=Thermococcus sp. TaxID=35749 RepID=UPI00260700FC|nr:AAA family ATPase [Thermococcus sp.]
MKYLWENFFKEIIETPPEKILENIDDRFERWEQIKGVGKGLISETLAFYYPNHFVPWNNTVDWYFQELGWGKPTKYSEVLSHLGELKMLFNEECSHQDINFVIVDHFGWWLKNKKDTAGFGNRKTNAYIEITKPPGEPYLKNHVGRFLWSPADKRYWNGREGKIGLLKTGDITIHDVKGKIIGYSKVAEKPTVVSKEEIMKIFNKEGIWSEEYSKFAEGWFKKSPNGEFYFVRLEGFQTLPKKVGYTKLSSLPHPSSIQGVYLKEISPKVLEELDIVLGINDNSGSQRLLVSSYLEFRGYLYPSHLVSQFYTALKTKGFVILSGLTGTGKTKIAQELAELLGDSGDNFLFLSVRPDWRDSKALLGYYNPLTGNYHKTKLLEFILKARGDYEQNRGNAKPYFVLLDEMNLAHVEYYFADFLSVLESGRDEEGFTREPLRLHDVDKVEEEGIPKEIHLPPNLYIIGTVNMDETTYAFSPKVLDRAFVVEFHDVELDEYPLESSDSEEANGIKDSFRALILQDLAGSEGMFLARSKNEINEAVREFKGEHPDYWNILVNLNRALEPYDMHFGYRVVDEIALFFQSAKESWNKNIVEFKDENEIFDLALLMKVLPKFHGNRKKLEEPLRVILKLCLSENANIDVQGLGREAVVKLLKNWETVKENFRFKHTAKKVLRMLRQLYEIGFASIS